MIMHPPLHTYIDHTLLRPEATKEEIKKLCGETLSYKFASACFLPVWAQYARSLLDGAKLCCVVGFPLGANTTKTKVFEAHELVKIGVDELDMVLALGPMKSRDYEYVLNDIRSLVKAAEPALIKVIIETCLLTDEEKRIASLLCMEAEAHFVKTSTGFSQSGATVEDIALIRKTVGPHMGIKASGGIRSAEKARAMIEAGATRIGTSSATNWYLQE
jgi:deoxyribose-phosphate aldolase